jgi:threonine dehydrogenase-like Zn-dependent dehydrogenase
MPDHISFEEEAMRDILGVAVHAVGRAEIRPGTSVLCIGGGPAGLCMAQVARARGCGHVVISDPSPLARRIIAQYEQFTAVDPSKRSVSQVLQETAEGERFGAAFDSVGTAETAQEALSVLEETGVYVNVAVHDTPLSFSALALGSERTMTTSSNAYYRDEREAHDMISARSVDVRPMITHRFPLEQFQEAFDLLLRVPKEAYKVVLEPWR